VGLIDEIREQPAVAERMLADEAPRIRRIATAVAEHRPEFVVIAARGSSDNAAIHAQYAFGTVNRLPVALAAPSIVSLYGVQPGVRRGLVIGISQSGVSPDVCETIESARRQGAPTIAMTNDPSSRLAAAAEHVIDLGAGPELAVAATKTYTAELLAVTLLSLALADDAPVGAAELARLPNVIS
jgi:glucosamine--fructose-6-phosphate aminotransferase (isomerizing)